MRKLDWAAAWLLLALGGVHIFVAAPLTFHVLDQRALWFVAGGLSLGLASGLNLVWLADTGRPLARRVTLVGNIAMLAFVLTYAWVGRQFDKPAGLLLIAAVAWLTTRSALVSRAPRSPAM